MKKKQLISSKTKKNNSKQKKVTGIKLSSKLEGKKEREILHYSSEEKCFDYKVLLLSIPMHRLIIDIIFKGGFHFQIKKMRSNEKFSFFFLNEKLSFKRNDNQWLTIFSNVNDDDDKVNFNLSGFIRN